MHVDDLRGRDHRLGLPVQRHLADDPDAQRARGVVATRGRHRLRRLAKLRRAHGAAGSAGTGAIAERATAPQELGLACDSNWCRRVSRNGGAVAWRKVGRTHAAVGTELRRAVAVADQCWRGHFADADRGQRPFQRAAQP